MTLDRLRPARECGYFLTLTKRNAGYQALAVPATFEIGPNVARSFTGIPNLTEAIQQNDWISEDRSRFLIERLPYWVDWGRLERVGFINSGDSE
jgi:hypothetical protein